MTELAIAVWAVGIAAWLAFVVYVYCDLGADLLAVGHELSRPERTNVCKGE